MMVANRERSLTPPGQERWLRALRWLGIDLRPEEQRLVGGLFLASFVLGVFQFSSKAVRQAGYIDQFGADRLPYVYLAVALSAYPVLRLYGAAAARFSSMAVIAYTLAAIVVGLVGFWWLMASPAAWVPVAYYVFVAIATALALSQLWSLTNTFLNARQARRLFGLIGAGSLLGGVAGGQLASVSREQPRNALLGAAVMLLVMIYVVYRLHRDRQRRLSLTGEILLPNAEAGMRGKSSTRVRGLELLVSSKHLRLIAGILVITVIVAQIIDLQFSWVVENTRSSTAGRVSAFGNVFSLMGLAAFLFQVVLTPRIHRSFGVGHAMRVLPGFVAFGCIGLLLVSSFAPVLLVFAVGLLRVGDNGLRYSLDHVTRELLFVPVPAAQRVEAKAYIDVFVHRFGKALGAVLLLLVTVGWVSVLQMTWITLALVGVWMLLTVQAKQRYVEALRRGISEGEAWSSVNSQPAELALDPNDINTLEILVEALGSAEKSKVVGSLELLRKHNRAKLIPPLLLYHHDPEVRRITLEVMMEAERTDALPLIERCVGDPDADVRAVAVSVLALLSRRDGSELMAPRLVDSDPRIRAAAVHCLLTQGDDTQRAQAVEAFSGLLSDADPAVRMEAAKALGGLPEPTMQQHVIALLFDSDKEVARAMIVALRLRVEGGEPSPLYVPILVSLLRDRRLKHDARETLVACGKAVLPALSHFLNDPNEHIWVRRAIPKTLVHFGGQGVAPILYQNLESCEDPMQLSKVIEALASMPHHRLDVPRLHRCIHQMVGCYFESLSVLDSLTEGGFELRGTNWRPNRGADDTDGADPVGSPPIRQPLVVQLMEENRRNVLGNITTLLGLLVPGIELDDLFAEPENDERRRRSSNQVVEYLDNVLDGALRDEVLLVFDDLPAPRRLERAWNQYGIPRRSEEGALSWLLSRADGHEAERWLAAAAAHRVGELQLEHLYPEVVGLASNASEGLVRETAQEVVEGMIA